MTNRWKQSVVAAVAMVIVATPGCDKTTPADNSASAANAKERYRIVCTVGMVADIVAEVAGDKANVRALIGASIDPHLYQASRDDIVTLMDADVVFYNGRLLEGKMTDTLVKVSGKRPVFAVTDGIPDDRLLAPAEFAGHYDPHVWMDAALWKMASQFVAAKLGEFDSPNAAYYNDNAARLGKQLDDLDAYARKTLATIPEGSRVLVTAHDAFNYFGRAYGIEVRGIQGISTESEAGIRDINTLVDLIVTRKIAAVFVESSVSEKNVTALVEGATSRGQPVRIGGTLFSDAMGTSGTYEGTYIGMIDHNVTTIARALGGDAPELGMQGRLAAPRK